MDVLNPFRYTAQHAGTHVVGLAVSATCNPLLPSFTIKLAWLLSLSVRVIPKGFHCIDTGLYD